MMTHEEWQEALVAWQEAVQRDHRLIPPYCLCDACNAVAEATALVYAGHAHIDPFEIKDEDDFCE